MRRAAFVHLSKFPLACRRISTRHRRRVCFREGRCHESILSGSIVDLRESRRAFATYEVDVSVFSNFVSFRNWHHPSFMTNQSVEAKEDWLARFIESKPELLDTEAFLVVLRSLAESTEPDAPMRAERWVRKLEEISKSSQDPTFVMLTTECYQCVIDVWGKSETEEVGIIVARAERWFRKHLGSTDQKLRPDTACCNAFLNVCSRGLAFKRRNNSGSDNIRGYASKSQEVLQLMIDQRKKEGRSCTMAPNIDSFNYVFRAWTRCRKSLDVVDRVMEILQIVDDYNKEIDPDVSPNIRSYAMVRFLNYPS